MYITSKARNEQNNKNNTISTDQKDKGVKISTHKNVSKYRLLRRTFYRNLKVNENCSSYIFSVR